MSSKEKQDFGALEQMMKESPDIKPPREYLMIQKKRNIMKDFKASALLDDYNMISSSRDYVDIYPLQVKISEIKDYIDLNISSTLNFKEKPDDDDIRNFIFAIKEIDDYYVYNYRKIINSKKEKLTNNRK